MSATLYYIHDPMCSWCWGYRLTWQRLRQQLPDAVIVVNVLGGLARDTDQPMPEALQQQIQGHWRRIHELLGTEFNFDFWTANTPRRSTYPACRAVIAAARQGAEEGMIEAIQRGYYLRAMNPSDTPVLLQLAFELGLSSQRFVEDLESEETDTELKRQLVLARSLPINGFPSLVLEVSGKLLPVELDYQDINVTLADIGSKTP